MPEGGADGTFALVLERAPVRGGVGVQEPGPVPPLGPGPGCGQAWVFSTLEAALAGGQDRPPCRSRLTMTG